MFFVISLTKLLRNCILQQVASPKNLNTAQGCLNGVLLIKNFIHRKPRVEMIGKISRKTLERGRRLRSGPMHILGMEYFLILPYKEFDKIIILYFIFK